MDDPARCFATTRSPSTRRPCAAAASTAGRSDSPPRYAALEDRISQSPRMLAQRRSLPATRGQPLVAQRYTTIKVSQKRQQSLKDQKAQAAKDYAWESNFVIYVHNAKGETPLVQVVIYIETSASDEVFNKWNESVTTAWNGKFSIADDQGVAYPVTVQIVKAGKNAYKNYTVEVVKADKALGNRGLFGTESMTKWGENDPQDIPHEVGHMLGNLDEYGEVNGKNWEKEEDKSIMSRGDLPVRERHFSLIRDKVRENGVLGKNPKLVNSHVQASGKKLAVSLDQSLHERRVQKITEYLLDNIDKLDKKTSDWLEQNKAWSTDENLSQEVLKRLGL